MRIAIIDESAGRASIIQEGLAEAGLTDTVVLTARQGLLGRLEAIVPEVVLIDLENPSRDVLEDYFAVSRALARDLRPPDCRSRGLMRQRAMVSVAASLRKWLASPLPWRSAVLMTVLAVFIAGLHCLAYSALRGVEDDPVDAIAWSIVNIAPFLLAFEIGKSLRDRAATRRRALLGLVAVACGAALISILVQRLIGGIESGLAFEAVRRLPALVLLGSGWVAGHALGSRIAAAEPPEASEAILASDAFDWVRAAGNYVELQVEGRSFMIRLTMRQAEALLEPRGFVRIHRSTLVRRSAVIDYRSGKGQDEILLRCGTVFRVGESYRSGSAARLLQPRPA